MPDRVWTTIFFPTPLIFRYHLPLRDHRTDKRTNNALPSCVDVRTTELLEFPRGTPPSFLALFFLDSLDSFSVGSAWTNKILFRGPILSPRLEDKAGYGVGLSFRPASLYVAWRAGTRTRRHSRLHHPVWDYRIRSQMSDKKFHFYKYENRLSWYNSIIRSRQKTL